MTLPPRIILATTLPLLLFYLLYLSNTAFYRSFLEQVPLSKLARVHSFRLIGMFFILLFFLNELPRTFALVAGFGDIITALSSFFVAHAIKRNRPYAKNLCLLWNTFGFLDILITSATAIFLTKVSMETGAMGVEALTTFPFCFIPAFAPATIIFLHISIYRKLRERKFD